MIVPEQRLIFLHIQKTGGNSVRAALGRPLNEPEKHFGAPDLRDYYGAAEWDRCFKFAFVRNPWDRLVSWWSNIDDKRPLHDAGRKLNRFQDYVLGRARTFDEFLLNCGDVVEDIDGSKSIYRNQIDYLSADGATIMVDFVGRFEALAEDFARALELAGAPPAALPHENRSARRDYRSYYTPATMALVAERYERDITAFGYRF